MNSCAAKIQLKSFLSTLLNSQFVSSGEHENSYRVKRGWTNSATATELELKVLKAPGQRHPVNVPPAIKINKQPEVFIPSRLSRFRSLTRSWLFSFGTRPGRIDCLMRKSFCLPEFVSTRWLGRNIWLSGNWTKAPSQRTGHKFDASYHTQTLNIEYATY